MHRQKNGNCTNGDINDRGQGKLQEFLKGRFCSIGNEGVLYELAYKVYEKAKKMSIQIMERKDIR